MSWVVDRGWDNSSDGGRRVGWCWIRRGRRGACCRIWSALKDTGVEVTKPTTRDAAHAAQGFYDAVMDGSLTHLDDAPLAAALAGAQKRDLGDMWLWARKGLSVDICPLVAGSLALWGFASRPEGQAAPPGDGPSMPPSQAPGGGLYRPNSRLAI
jgi:hypothetical protein